LFNEAGLIDPIEPVMKVILEQALGVKDTNPERQKDFTRLSHSMDLSPGNLK